MLTCTQQGPGVDVASAMEPLSSGAWRFDVVFAAKSAKKRKLWSDGVLVVTPQRCSLFSSSDNRYIDGYNAAVRANLAYRLMSADPQAVTEGLELELPGHLVSITQVCCFPLGAPGVSSDSAAQTRDMSPKPSATPAARRRLHENLLPRCDPHTPGSIEGPEGRLVVPRVPPRLQEQRQCLSAIASSPRVGSYAAEAHVSTLSHGSQKYSFAVPPVPLVSQEALRPPCAWFGPPALLAKPLSTLEAVEAISAACAKCG